MLLHGAAVIGIDPKRAVERCEQIAKLGPMPPWWRLFARRRWVRKFAAIMVLDITTLGEMLRSAYPTDPVIHRAQREHPAFLAMQKAPRSKT